MVGNQRKFDWRIECVERTRRLRSAETDEGYGLCIFVRQNVKLDTAPKRQSSADNTVLACVKMAFKTDLRLVAARHFRLFSLIGKMVSVAIAIVAF